MRLTLLLQIFSYVLETMRLDFGGTRNKDGLGFSAFGRVISGMDIVRKINLLPSKENREYLCSGQMLNNPVMIYKAERL